MKQTEYLNLKSKIKKIKDPMESRVLLDILDRIRDLEMRMDRNCLSQVPDKWKKGERDMESNKMTQLSRMANSYGVPFDEALDIWVEVNGDMSLYEERLCNWSKEL